MEKINSLSEVTSSIRETLWSIWGDTVDRLPYIVMGLLILVLFWGIASLASRLWDRMLRRSRMRTSLRQLVVRLISIGIWTVGFLIAALIMFPGLTPAKALGGLGVLSLAVGLAFKDIFENFFAGMLILWRFPFENGDFIECDGVTGKVVDVTARMTRIRTVTGELVVMPNAVLFKNAVTVMTAETNRRMQVIVGIAYAESVPPALSLIESTVKDCDSVAGHLPIEVFTQEFADSSVNIEVCWWTGSTPLAQRRSRSQVLTAIKQAFDTAGIEIPFPYRTLTFNEPLPVRTLPAAEHE